MRSKSKHSKRHIEHVTAWKKRNPGKHKQYCSTWYKNTGRWRALKRTYGITKDEYVILAKLQNDLCAICNKSNGDKVLHVDHDHESGQIRGLLCNNCNTAIGLFKEDVALMKNAIFYVERFKVAK